MKIVFAIVLSLLMFGCLVKPVGPLESGIAPPPGLDVREALSADELYANEPLNENASNVEDPGFNETLIQEINETNLDNETVKENETSTY